MKTMPYLILLILTVTCATSTKSSSEAKARERMKSLDQGSQENINQLIEMITEQERVTDPGAKHYIPYEFMIPLDSAKRMEVQHIDSSVRFTKRTDSYQCIGDHATKEKVYQIVALPYAYKIRFCPFE
jgi:hypothetical protein